MPRLTAQELKEVLEMKPIAECVTCYDTKAVVIAINHFDFDEVVAQFDGNTPAKFRIQTEDSEDWGERQYFSAAGRRWYLDEIVRYNSPWMGGRI